MQNKIVLCDADDTILNLCTAWIDRMNQKYGTKVKYEDVVDRNISLFFPSQSKEEVYAPVYEKDFWKQITPVDGCFDVLKKINQFYNLYIVTATNYQTCDTKIEQILHLFPFLQWSQFIVTEKKQLINGDYLIDDGIHNFYGGKYSGILFDRPHNHFFNHVAAGLVRVHDWKEISQILL